MKIFINNKMYVQIKDISFVIHISSKLSEKCPNSILLKYFNRMKNNDNKYEFIEFDNKEEINFFKKLDFIISYKDYKNLSFDKMNRYIENIGNELNILADKYHDLDEKEQNKRYDRYCTIFEKEYYKMESIRELYKIKIGELIIDFPKEKGIKKLIKKIRKD